MVEERVQGRLAAILASDVVLQQSNETDDRNCTFAFRGTLPDVRKVGEELGARSGRVKGAGAALEAYRRSIPKASERRDFFWRCKNESDHEHLLDGLRKAGWEG